jgi:hypothetical protein
VRSGRGGQEAGATGVKVASIGAGQVEAKELDSPLARGAGVISAGSVPATGTAVVKGFIIGRGEADKGRGTIGTGNQDLDVGRIVTVCASVKWVARVGGRGANEEVVGQRTEAPKMVKGSGEEKHVLVNQGLDNGRVGRSGTTTELLPLSKVMRLSSGSHCKRCITLRRGRRPDSYSHQ